MELTIVDLWLDIRQSNNIFQSYVSWVFSNILMTKNIQ